MRPRPWGRSSAGRASQWHCEGQGFDPPRLHQVPNRPVFPVTYAGVELGGTKCVAILARAADDVLMREVIPTTSPEETLGRIEATLLEWRSSHGFEALGIASFGPIDVDTHSPTYGHVLATPKPGWAS